MFRGVALVLAAAVLWGTTGTAQSLAPSALSPYWVGALRLAVAALFFGPALGLTDRAAVSPARLRRLPWPGIALAAACMCAYNLAFFAGVRACGVAVGTAVALGSGPLWAGVLQAALHRAWPRAAWWLGTALAVAGVAAMATAGGVSAALSPVGVLLCLLAGLSYAVYARVNQQLVNTASPTAVTALVFGAAAPLALAGAAALAGLPPLRGGDVAVVLWLGVASTGVAYLLFSHALRHVSAATGVVLALAEPVVAFALAVAVVGERPGWAAVLGLGAVLAGLVVVVRSERAPCAPTAPAPASPPPPRPPAPRKPAAASRRSSAG